MQSFTSGDAASDDERHTIRRQLPPPLKILTPDGARRYPLSAPSRTKTHVSSEPYAHDNDSGQCLKSTLIQNEPVATSTSMLMATLTTPGIDASQIRLSGIPLGRGSFGSVWRATFAGSPVAVKICSLSVRHDSRESRSAIQHFRRETARYYHLRHPCIVQFFCVVHDQVANNLLLVTELMKGGSLFHSLQNLRLSGCTALPTLPLIRTATYIANGLAYLHASNFSFGDLKSMNVLLSEPADTVNHTFTPTTQAKLCDFGLSRNLNRLVPSETHIPAHNGPAGTFAYLAPEAFSGLPIDDSAAPKAADVYALAIVLWELATVKPPWPQKQPLQLFRLVVKEGRRPPWPHHHRLPAGFIRLVESCWQKDPSRRPSAKQVAAGLSTMLDALLEDEDFEQPSQPDIFRRRTMSTFSGSHHALALALDADILKDLHSERRTVDLLSADDADDSHDGTDNIDDVKANVSISDDAGTTMDAPSSCERGGVHDDITDGIADVVVVDDEDVCPSEQDTDDKTEEDPSKDQLGENEISVGGFVFPATPELYEDEEGFLDDEYSQTWKRYNDKYASSKVSNPGRLPDVKGGKKGAVIEKFGHKSVLRSDTSLSLKAAISRMMAHHDTMASMSDVTQQTVCTSGTIESTAAGCSSGGEESRHGSGCNSNRVSATRLGKYSVPPGVYAGLDDELLRLERENEVGFYFSVNSTAFTIR